MSRYVPSLVCGLALLTIAASASANQQVYQRALHSTAWVITADGSSGSGVVVNLEDKLLVTNFHVVGLADEVLICFPAYRDGRPIADREYYRQNVQSLGIRGKVLRRDPKRDLAIVEVDRLPRYINAMPLASEPIGTGEEVHSIGNSGDVGLWIYTSGTVRQVLHRTIGYSDKFAGMAVDALFVDTQSPVNPGDSGGPVVNNACELVAITQSRETEQAAVSHCVEVSEVRALLNGEIKAIDQRVVGALRAMNVEPNVDALGVFTVEVKLQEGSERVVYVDSNTQQFAKLEVREVYAVATTFESMPAAEMSGALLANNHQKKLGAWEYRSQGKGVALVFCVRLPADVDNDTLVSAILTTARVAQNLTNELRELANPTAGSGQAGYSAQASSYR